MNDAPDWKREGAHWPNHEASSFVRAAGLEWHVQRMGKGEPLLLLHGTGASTHSWAGLLPLLAEQYDVIAPDLPGHGFTSSRPSGMLSLPFVARAVSELAEQLEVTPRIIVGHSAGAAIALSLSPRLPTMPVVIGINAAMSRFEGIASWAFPMLARLLALNPLTARIFTLGGPNPARARRLIEGTGSRLSDEGLALYARLIADRAHVEATLQMMTQWRIDPLVDALPRITAPTLLIAATGDRAVPAATSDEAAQRMPRARVEKLTGLGHLAHEEAPDRVAGLATAFIETATGSTTRELRLCQ